MHPLDGWSNYAETTGKPLHVDPSANGGVFDPSITLAHAPILLEARWTINYSVANSGNP